MRVTLVEPKSDCSFNALSRPQVDVAATDHDGGAGTAHRARDGSATSRSPGSNASCQRRRVGTGLGPPQQVLGSGPNAVAIARVAVVEAAVRPFERVTLARRRAVRLSDRRPVHGRGGRSCDRLLQRNRPGGCHRGHRPRVSHDRPLGQRRAGASQNNGDGGEQSFAHRPSLPQFLISGPSGLQQDLGAETIRAGGSSRHSDRPASNLPPIAAQLPSSLTTDAKPSVLSTRRRAGSESNLSQLINSPRLRGLTACIEIVEIAAMPEVNGIADFTRRMASFGPG